MAHQPHNLVATPVSTTEIELSWDDVGTLEDETFDIERDSVIVEASYTGTHSVAAPYTDTGLDPNTEYTYRVRAVGGTAPASVSVTPTTVATRATMFTPTVGIVADASVTPTTVSAVAVAFTPAVATTTSTITPATVVGAVSVETPTITGESYSDSYSLPYGSTAFLPTDITGLALWLGADQLLGVGVSLPADGTAVSSWSDLSAQGNHAVQATGGNQPTFETSVVNGQPVVRFTAANSHYLAANGAASVFSGTDKAFTLFIAYAPTNVTNIYTVIGPGRSSSATPLMQFDSWDAVSSPRLFRRDDASATSNGAFDLTSAASFKIFVVRHTGTSMRGYFHNATGTAGVASDVGATTLDRVGIGALYRTTPSNYFDGDIGAIALYDTELSLANTNLVGQYLGTKYGLTWTNK